MSRRRWTLPLALGVITALLLLAVLWPKEVPMRKVLVASHDLGAGTVLTSSDLAATQMDATQAPADAVADPQALIGQTLAVVRFAGEPITPRHLGPAVTLAPDERGIAIKVQADTGLAGILRPGMKVGVIATLTRPGEHEVYAKTVLEGLRVLYVSPDFQARPYTPATASATVRTGSSAGGGGLLGLDSSQPTCNPGFSGTVREGVLILAASIVPQPVRYELITDTLKVGLPEELETAGEEKEEPPTVWATPVELLAGLNAQGGSLALTLLPETPRPYTSAGISTAALRQEELVAGPGEPIAGSREPMAGSREPIAGSGGGKR